MSRAATSVFVFGWYLLAEGATLLLFPNILLRLVDVEETQEVWIRLLGIALLILGYYYVRAGRGEVREFFPWTVHMRLAQFVGIVGLVLLGLGQPVILAFAGVEFASGLWTLSALRSP